MKDLRGRVAVVTGAASGIGLALTERFAAEGMKVVMADIEGGALEAASERLRRHGATVGGGFDQGGEALFARLLFLGADHPPDGGAAVGGRLRLEP